MLLIFHRKLQKWVPPGGHLEPNELPHECAIREVREETGIEAQCMPIRYPLRLTTELQLPQPYCILHEVIPPYKSELTHMHIDFIYLMVAPERAKKKTVENGETGWFTKTQIEGLTSFDALKEIARRELQ